MNWRAAQRMEGVERTLIRQIFDAAPADAINLGLGQPDLPSPAPVAIAGVSAIVRGRTAYTSTAGDPALRAAVAERYRPFARSPEDVLITVGSQEAMFVSVLCLVDPGGEVLYPDPGYPAYPVVAQLVGAKPVAYPLHAEDGFRIRIDEIERRLNGATRLVILCSPSNPTGACSRADELRALVELLGRRGVPWLSDEIYAAFCYEERFVSASELSPAGGLVISGLSKEMSMTGWRVGWAVGPREIVSRMTAAHQYLVTCAPSISQAAALAAFSPEGERERRRILERFRGRRQLMAAELSGIPGIQFEMPQGAFYFFVDVSRFGSSLALSRRILERRNVITIPGLAFGSRGEGHLRLSYAAGEEEIRRGVRAIGEELAAP